MFIYYGDSRFFSGESWRMSSTTYLATHESAVEWSYNTATCPPLRTSSGGVDDKVDWETDTYDDITDIAGEFCY